MTQDEFAFALRAYCSRRPFRPFLIEFHSGVTVSVPHPESVDRLGPVFFYRGPQRSQSVFAAGSVS